MGIKFDNIKKKFKNNEVLKGVTFEAKAGEVTWLVGENGCGKTTLLKAALGLISKDDGVIEFDGKPLRKVRNDIAVLYDDVPCYENVNVKTNLYILSNRSVIKKEELSKVISEFELEKLLKQSAGSLSLGQKHRLLMAACMLRTPKYFFLDEPTIGLDINSFNKMEKLFNDLKESGSTIIVTGHDLMYLSRIADKIVYLKDGYTTYIDEFTEETLTKSK